MPRFFCSLGAARRLIVVALAGGLILAAVPHRIGAADSKQLQRVRGTIGYQTAEAGTDFKAVVGKLDLPDDDFAVTRAQSAAVVALPDSSLVSLGENTNVQVGAFNTTTAGPGSTIKVLNGSLRFDIRRPQGGVANYRFTTSTSTVGVRGTVGLLSFVNGVTTVGCVACAADSVTVTVGTQTVALATGQILVVSATGIITTGALTAATAAFTGAGVPISAQTGAIAAGLPAATTGTIAGVATGTAAAVGVGAAVAGAVIGTATQASPKPNDNGSPNSTPTPSGNGQPGDVNLNGAQRKELARPTPSPTPVAPIRSIRASARPN